MTLAFGIMIEGQEGLTWERWEALARAAEVGGWESLFRSDHLTGLFGGATRPSLASASAPAGTRASTGCSGFRFRP